MGTTTPHYVRFARALALAGGMAGMAGCYATTEPGTGSDGGARPDAAPIADAGRDSGHDGGTIVNPCTTCTCSWRGGDVDAGSVVFCEETGHTECCLAVGPLFPPDLAA
jgi:hypothetical protein